MPRWIAISFQDRSSPTMEQLTFFHDHAMIVLILITILTLYLLSSFAFSRSFHKFIGEGQEIETIWTVLPAVLLIFIALPSLKVLYLIEDTKSPSLTVKVNGHQWFWSYEHSSFSQEEVDSFIEDSKISRLLKTRSLLAIPSLTSVRVLISSRDVIHAWAIPSIGVKVDALPGRINQTFISSKRTGLFTGQCSEICGINHSFIPIVIKVTSPSRFIEEIKNLT
jgi:cytochrome c oxidase subunit 2